MSGIRKPTGRPVRRPPPVKPRPWFLALAIRGWRAVGPTSANRQAFREWLARRGPFTIGVVYGLMLPGYAFRGWLSGVYAAGRDWRHDREYVLRWSQVGRRAAGDGQGSVSKPASPTSGAASPEGSAETAPQPSPPKPRCSFCGRSKDSGARLVGGPGTTAICDECVGGCHELLWPAGGEAGADVGQKAPNEVTPPVGHDAAPYTFESLSAKLEEIARAIEDGRAPMTPLMKAPFWIREAIRQLAPRP